MGQLPSVSGLEPTGDQREEIGVTEDDIVYECGWFWVGREPSRYTVFRAGVTHSVSDSSYRKNGDGLSLAVARCNYLNISHMPYPPPLLGYRFSRTSYNSEMNGSLVFRDTEYPTTESCPALRAALATAASCRA